MGGFLAIHPSDGSVPDDVVEQLCEAMAYRGAPQRWQDERGVLLVAFGDASLAVTDDLAVVADARLDQVPAETAGASSAEQILNAWRRWGEAALDRLIGDFAATVLDRRDGRTWFIRDAMGGRPALIGRARGRVVAGSSIAGLLADPGLDQTIDEAWVADYLANVPAFATRTGYRSIARLEPGTLARCDDGRDVRVRRWFTWRPRAVRARDPREYGEGFRELFTTAVADRIRGASRLGVMLSGGLDSSSVAVTARSIDPALEMVALSMPFDGKGDERALQQLVAERVGARLRWASLEGRNPFGTSAADTIQMLGTPPVPPNVFHAFAVADAGAAEGVDVALDGIDGDGIIGGNWLYLADLAITGRWRRWAREARAIRDVHGASRRMLLTRYTLEPLVPWRVRALRGRSEQLIPASLAPGFADKHNVRNRMLSEPWRPGRAFRSQELVAASTRILPLVAEVTNEIWMRRGITVAHPFLDQRLVAFCLGLPRRQKTANGVTKIALRQAVGSLLPSEVAERTDKAELAEPFFTGLWGSGWQELAEGLTGATSNPSAWFQRERIEGLRHSLGRSDLYEAFRTAFVVHWIRWLSRQRSATNGTRTRMT